jgi:hypothetical protein
MAAIEHERYMFLNVFVSLDGGCFLNSLIGSDSLKCRLSNGICLIFLRQIVSE